MVYYTTVCISVGACGWQCHDQEPFCWQNCWAQQTGISCDTDIISLESFNLQLQDSDGKSSHYYAEVCLFVVCLVLQSIECVLQCRALHKQLNHNSAIRTKLAQDLQVATDAIQQLQVCLGATSLIMITCDTHRHAYRITWQQPPLTMRSS